MERRNFLKGLGLAAPLGFLGFGAAKAEPVKVTSIKPDATVSLLKGQTTGIMAAVRPPTHGLFYIPIESIWDKGMLRTPNNKTVDDLKVSIAKSGLFNPIIVSPMGNDQYQLEHGVQRLEACRCLNMRTIAANIRSLGYNNLTLMLNEIAYVPVRPDKVAQIADSMAKHGLLSPCFVCPDPATGRGYIVLDGAARVEAARSLNWTTIAVEVRAMSREQIADYLECKSRDESWVPQIRRSAELPSVTIKIEPEQMADLKDTLTKKIKAELRRDARKAQCRIA